MKDELKTTEGEKPDVNNEGSLEQNIDAGLDKADEGQATEGQKETTENLGEDIKEAKAISDPNARIMYLGKERTLAEAEKIYKGLQVKSEKDKQAWTKESESLKGLKQLDTFLRANPDKAAKVKAIIEDLAEEKTGVKKKWFDMSDEEQAEALEELVESRDAIKNIKSLDIRLKNIETLLQNAGQQAKQTEEETQLESEIKENIKRLKLDTPEMKEELSLFWEILGSAKIEDDDDIASICDMVFEKITNFSKSKVSKYVDGKKPKWSGLEGGGGKLIVKDTTKPAFDQETFSEKIEKKFATMETS
jgi:hypothetical protein